MEEIIVTIRDGDNGQDYALPADMPLKELYPRLHQILTVNRKVLRDCSGIVLEFNGGGMLDGNATLADYGVCSGSFLDVAGKEKYDVVR